MATTNKEMELQMKLDAEKWVASEKAGRDLCGEMPYCAFCNKALKNPCAKATAALKKKEKEVAATQCVKAPVKKTGSTCKKK